jgi:hypothetical protein
VAFATLFLWYNKRKRRLKMFFKAKVNDEDIFVGFINEVGKLDLEGILEYLKENEKNKVILIARKDLNDKVRPDFDKIKEKYDIEFRKAVSFRKEIKKIKEEYKDKKIRVQDLLEFGKRNLSKDVC